MQTELPYDPVVTDRIELKAFKLTQVATGLERAARAAKVDQIRDAFQECIKLTDEVRELLKDV